MLSSAGSIVGVLLRSSSATAAVFCDGGIEWCDGSILIQLNSPGAGVISGLPVYWYSLLVVSLDFTWLEGQNILLE